MVTVCPSQFATRRTLFHVLVGCGLLMLKVSRLKLPVIWLLVSMWLNTLTKSQIWTLLLKVKELRMEQLTKNQAVATSQEAVQNQNEPQLRDENAHNDKSVHGVLNPTYQAGYDATPVNQILKQNAKREMRLRLGKVTVADVLAAQPVTTNLLKFMRASIKMIGVSNLQSFIASMTQKLTLSDISDESKNYLDKAGITTACLRIKSKWTAGGK